MNIKQKGAKKEENKNIKEVNKSDRIRGREFLKWKKNVHRKRNTSLTHHNCLSRLIGSSLSRRP